MKRTTNLTSGMFSLLIISICLAGTVCLTQSCKGTMEQKKDAQWYDDQDWMKGLQMKPHPSTNQKEFEKQYRAYPKGWDMAFEWLKTNDLDAIEPGTYYINGDSVRAIVSEGPAAPLDSVKWEAHRNFNDLQYILKGKAKMGVSPVAEAIVTEAYDPDSDVGFFDAEGVYYTAEPGTFFIFTPEEAHRPGIRIEGYDTVKRVVMKVSTAGR
jgi:biofilm protein TabA